MNWKSVQNENELLKKKTIHFQSIFSYLTLMISSHAASLNIVELLSGKEIVKIVDRKICGLPRV